MTKRVKLSALGSCAIVVALACSGSLARATVDFLKFDKRGGSLRRSHNGHRNRKRRMHSGA
jgi:hypothetical protein